MHNALPPSQPSPCKGEGAILPHWVGNGFICAIEVLKTKALALLEEIYALRVILEMYCLNKIYLPVCLARNRGNERFTRNEVRRIR